MGQYFFTVKNNVDFRDSAGRFFAKPEEAIAYAEVIARELTGMKKLRDAWVEVADEQGNVVAEVMIPPSPPELPDRGVRN